MKKKIDNQKKVGQSVEESHRRSRGQDQGLPENQLTDPIRLECDKKRNWTKETKLNQFFVSLSNCCCGGEFLGGRNGRRIGSKEKEERNEDEEKNVKEKEENKVKE